MARFDLNLFIVLAALHRTGRVLKLPFELPDIELGQYWHRRFHKNERNRWLRRLIAELFNDFADEWTESLDRGGRAPRRRSA